MSTESATRSLARFVPWVGGAVAALLGLGLAILLYNRFGDGGVRAAVRTYQVSDTSVRIEFSVTKPPGDTVLCNLRARDRRGEVIGDALVRVGPSIGGSVLVTHELPTTSRASTGEVIGCTDAPEPP